MIAPVERSFLDVRAHGFARVAVVIPEVRVADPAWNVAAHLRLLAQVRERGAQYAVCPELGISGYTCNDLFFQETLLSATRDAQGNLVEGNSDQVVTIADEWTFARNPKSRDPNWKLVATNQID